MQMYVERATFSHLRVSVASMDYSGKQDLTKKKLLYHGGDSALPVENIQFPGLRVNCDFGQGFYLAENKEAAEEWNRKKLLDT
jgi:hypothetical protein